ncbi:MAG: hypothetical protein P4L50_10305 [Anaerolineaceae bacterium]|nr:hypothetical protein [Anaerolineaceae bacterium]
MPADAIIRDLIILDVVIMALLAIFYLRKRRLTWWEFCGWGLLALMLPLVGPFLIIVLRPGKRHRNTAS